MFKENIQNYNKNCPEAGVTKSLRFYLLESEMDQFFLKGTDVDDCTLPEFKHLLIVFGGVGGIEAALEVIIYLCTLRLIKRRNKKTTISCVFDVVTKQMFYQ